MLIILLLFSRSPNSRKAANTGNTSDSRCAASERTIPACSTARAITTKMLGNNTPKAKNGHKPPISAPRKLSNGGASKNQQQVVATI